MRVLVLELGKKEASEKNGTVLAVPTTSIVAFLDAFLGPQMHGNWHV